MGLTGKMVRRAGWGVLLWGPAVWVAVFVWRFGVDVPFWDDWYDAAVIVRAWEGALTWGDVLGPHNEHRPAVPRLIALALSWATHWDRRAAMGISVAVVVATVWLVRRIGARTLGETTAARWAGVVAGVYLFSLVQRENWLWAFQVEHVLPGLMMAAGLWVMTWPRARVWVKALAGAGLAVMATMSMAAGLLVWGVLGMALWVAAAGTRRRWVWVSAWVGVAGVVAAVYLVGLEYPRTRPDYVRELWHAGQRASYVATFVGMPAGWGVGPGDAGACWAAGVGMLGVLAAAGVYLAWRKDAELEPRAVPWLGVAGYTLACAVAASFQRPNPWDALISRYSTSAVWLAAGVSYLVALVVLDVGARWGRSGRWVRWAAAGLAVVAVAMGVWTSAAAWAMGPGEWRARLRVAGMGQLIRVDGPAAAFRLDPFHPTADVLHWAEALDRLGMLRPGLRDPADVRAWAGEEGIGEVDEVRRDDGLIRVRGWAVLPGGRRAADVVVLAADMPDGRAAAIGVVDVFTERAAARRRWGAACAACAWAGVVRADRVPAGAVGVSAWAYDAEDGRAHRLEERGP